MKISKKLIQSSVTIKEKDSKILVDALSLSITQRGYNATLRLLQETRKVDRDALDDFDNYVLDNVCSSFKIKYTELIESKYERGFTKYAIGLCVYYLYMQKSLKYIQQNIFWKMGVSVLNKYKLLITNLKENHKHDMPFVKIKKELDKKIDNYLNLN